MFGDLVVYAADVLLRGSGTVIDRITEALKAKWNITDKPAFKWGSGDHCEYLSVDIQALSDGWYLSQPHYTRDLLAKWAMKPVDPSPRSKTPRRLRTTSSPSPTWSTCARRSG